MKYHVATAVGLVACGLSSPVLATPITFTGTSGSLAARVDFDLVGSNLIVTLTNTSTADVLVPTSVLTAVFFDIAGNPALSPVSAVLATGSSVFFGSTDPGNAVGGEMAYKTGLVGTPGNATQGISSVGLGLFGPGDRFAGNNLQGPASPNGLQYGLTSAGDDPTTGNAAVTGSNALIDNSVVYALTGLPSGFLLSNISNVQFQYGTSLTDTSVPGIGGGIASLPTSFSLLSAGLVALAWLGKREA